MPLRGQVLSTSSYILCLHFMAFYVVDPDILQAWKFITWLSLRFSNIMTNSQHFHLFTFMLFPRDCICTMESIHPWSTFLERSSLACPWPFGVENFRQWWFGHWALLNGVCIYHCVVLLNRFASGMSLTTLQAFGFISLRVWVRDNLFCNQQSHITLMHLPSGILISK